jgi:hypothetical protein
VFDLPPTLLAHTALMMASVALCAAAILRARGREEGWLTQHRALALAGVLPGMAGVLVMVVVESLKGHPHLASLHAKLAVASSNTRRLPSV